MRLCKPFAKLTREFSDAPVYRSKKNINRSRTLWPLRRALRSRDADGSARRTRGCIRKSQAGQEISGGIRAPFKRLLWTSHTVDVCCAPDETTWWCQDLLEAGRPAAYRRTQ